MKLARHLQKHAVAYAALALIIALPFILWWRTKYNKEMEARASQSLPEAQTWILTENSKEIQTQTRWKDQWFTAILSDGRRLVGQEDKGSYLIEGYILTNEVTTGTFMLHILPGEPYRTRLSGDFNRDYGVEMRKAN